MSITNDIEKELNNETEYLSSIPGFVENINKIRNTEDWTKAKEFNPDEEW